MGPEPGEVTQLLQQWEVVTGKWRTGSLIS